MRMLGLEDVDINTTTHSHAVSHINARMGTFTDTEADVLAGVTVCAHSGMDYSELLGLYVENLYTESEHWKAGPFKSGSTVLCCQEAPDRQQCAE